MTCLFNKSVYTVKFTVEGIDSRSFFDRLIGTGRRYLIRNFSVKPADSPAEGRMFGGYDTDMVGSKGLAERAGLIGVHI
jgi:hypothetical protein